MFWNSGYLLDINWNIIPFYCNKNRPFLHVCLCIQSFQIEAWVLIKKKEKKITIQFHGTSKSHLGWEEKNLSRLWHPLEWYHQKINKYYLIMKSSIISSKLQFLLMIISYSFFFILSTWIYLLSIFLRKCLSHSGLHQSQCDRYLKWLFICCELFLL